MTRISVFVHDLSSNPIVRAAPIAEALQRAGYEVEVLGFLMTGDCVYAPYRNAFHYRVRFSSIRPWDVLASGRSLAREATGEIFYAFKPLWTTFYPALLASGMARKAPLLLDVEDEELTFTRRNPWLSLLTEPILRWRNVNSLKYKLALHPATRRAHAVSVVSTKLKKRYGGEIVLHGPSAKQAVPSRTVFELTNPESTRGRFGLPLDAPVVGFAGVPRPHKGLDTLVCALSDPALGKYHLALAGPSESAGFRQAHRELGQRCHLVGHLDRQEMPKFLSAIDIVPAIQRRNRITEAQIPAKVLEAMAMERIVVGSRVGDLPKIIDGKQNGPRGWLVDPDDPDQLAKTLEIIGSNPAEAQQRAKRARLFFEREASVEVNTDRVAALVESATRAWRRES